MAKFPYMAINFFTHGKFHLEVPRDKADEGSS